MMKKLAFVPLALMATQIASSQPVVTPPVFSVGDPTLGTLPTYNDAWANWKNAGLLSLGGIPNRTTQCGATVNPTGIANPPQANDDAVTISNAIAACTAGQIVQLAAGTFIVSGSESIIIGHGVTLRGSGTCIK